MESCLRPAPEWISRRSGYSETMDDMRRRLLVPAVVAVVLLPLLVPASGVTAGRSPSVILLIGDGMGDSEITVARNYQAGAAGRLALDRLPMTGALTTFSVRRDNPALPDYSPDSA